MKIFPLGADLFHAEGEADDQTEREMTQLIVTFHNFAKAPQNYVTSPLFTKFTLIRQFFCKTLPNFMKIRQTV
jgi:hypothetical protein